MQQRLVLWDVDHTLVDAGGLSGYCYGLVFRRRYGRELENRAPMQGRTDRAIVADTLRRNGILDSNGEVEAFRVGLEAVLREGPSLVREHGRALTGAAQALAALADQPYLVQSLLTGNVRPYAEAKVRPFGLHAYLDLDSGAYGWEHRVRSELVRVARVAAGRRHGADFSGLATVLVGDTPLDVEAALATGAAIVAVASGNYGVDELWEAGAHAVLPDLGDTDHVVETLLKVSA
jgi:phosphoglycolate phosphatase